MVSVSASGVFVGRGNELSALLRAVDTPQVRAAFVAGEAGIGKSRLVAEFVARQGSRTLVLLGRCPEFGSAGVPFAPFIAVLRALLREQGVSALAALLPAQPALARWLPELAGAGGSAEGGTDRVRLFGELLTLLEQLAAQRSVVLILEDLHWADDSSRELLTFLTANLAEPQLLIVGTYRPSGSTALRRLIAELRRNPAVQLIAPQPLTKHEVGRLLAALLEREPEPPLIARVFERSAGNPLFVEALSRSPEDTPAELTDLLLAAQADLDDAPREVLQLAAVAGSPVEHDLLAAAAGLPGAQLRNTLRQLIEHHWLIPTDTGYEFRHVLIREAVYQDLLPIERKRLHARLTNLLGDHPDLLPPKRLNAELARHARAAGEHLTALTSALAAAMDATLAGAHPERLHHLTVVLELWSTVTEGTAIDVGTAHRLADCWTPTTDSAARPRATERPELERVVVLEHIVDACIHTNAVDRGIEAADQALAQINAEAEPTRAAHLHRQRAQLRNHNGTGGHDELQHALTLLPAHLPTLLRGEILAELAATQVFAGDTTLARDNALAALAIAQQLHAAAATRNSLIAPRPSSDHTAAKPQPHNSPTASHPSSDQAAAKPQPHNSPTANHPTSDQAAAKPQPHNSPTASHPSSGQAAANPQAAQQAPIAPDASTTHRYSALAARAHAYLGLAETDSALAVQHFGRARAAAQEAQDVHTVLSVVTWESATLVGAGDYIAAIEIIQHGLRTAHEMYQFGERGPILLVKWAQALTALGRWTEAEELIADALGDPLPSLATAALHLCLARIALARGEFEMGATAVSAAEGQLGQAGWVGHYRLELIEVQAELAHADPARAARILADALSTDDVQKYPNETWPLLTLGTRIPEQAMDFEPLAAALPCTTPVAAAHRAVFAAATARADWQAAVTAWQAVQHPLEQARTLFRCARAELAVGNRPAAHTALRAAAVIADDLGARPLFDAIHDTAERARLPLYESARTRTEPPRTFGLTTRELDVLHLVAQGLSNRQIAAELFISANTAGVHVSRILTKLSAASRTEAAALAHQHRLLEPTRS
ncbi:AAA family ATPase [Nocardia sp. NPDC051832]|uniref:helix-turn-helix transcriptional regulator n=1 Tax=Nocardia sp. NPDC051832 TaxID=3155673 RepID=UPI0034397A81